MSCEGDLSTIIELISRISGVQALEPDRDFYDAGLTSVHALPLLMELEEHFQVSIPDERFVKARTPRALEGIITDLKTG